MLTVLAVVDSTCKYVVLPKCVQLGPGIQFNVQLTQSDPATMPWMWHVSRTCEYMVVDLDTCAWEDIMAALLKTKTPNHTVLFYTAKGVRREAIKLINATSSYITITNLEELNKFLDIDTRYPGMPDE